MLKKQKNLFVFICFCLLLVCVPSLLFGEGKQESFTSEEVTVTLGYNHFMEESFTDAPSPIEAIRMELAKHYPTINLEFNTMPADMLEPLVIMMTSRDDRIDIFGMNVPWVPQFGHSGWLTPLDEHIPELEDNFASGGLNVFSYGGNRVAIPFWNSLTGLFYRADILEEDGIEPPKTFDELVKIAKKIQKEKPEMAGLLWPGLRDPGLSMLYGNLYPAFGGDLGDDGLYQFDSKANKDVLEFLKRTIQEGITPRNALGWNRLEARPRFVEGGALFHWDVVDIVLWLDDPNRSEIAGKWGLIPVPSQPEGKSVSMLGGFGFSLNPYSKEQEAAINVLKVIASRPVQKAFALAWGPIQHYKGLYEDEEVLEYNPNVDKIMPLMDLAHSHPPYIRYGELIEMLQEEVNAAITESKSVEQTIENMTRRGSVIGGK